MHFSTQTQKLLDRLEKATGLPVEVEYDPSFGPYEGVSRVATPDNPTHRIILQDKEQESVIWHEVGHIERMMWTPKEKRTVVFLTQKAIEDLVELGFGEILNGIVGHIHRTVRNTVPDILIEQRIKAAAPSHVVAQQLESFSLAHQSQVSACAKLASSPHFDNLKPFMVLLGAYAVFGANIAKLAKAEKIPTYCEDLWNQSWEFLKSLWNSTPLHEGADGVFMHAWLGEKDVGEWFSWEPISYELPYLPNEGLIVSGSEFPPMPDPVRKNEW